MNQDDIRAALVAEVEAVKATFATYPLTIEYDNRIVVDPATQVNPFLCVEVDVYDGWQADLSSNPIHRLLGMLILTAKVKVGSGVKQQTDLLDFFYPKLQRRKIGPAILEMAKPDKARTVGGWVGMSALIPFRADRTY
jgi:hypothetical protein